MAQPWKIHNLDPNKSVHSCLKKILHTRVNEVFSYQIPALTHEDIEAVHDMRVAVRRLKAILTIYRLHFEPTPLKKLNTRLKFLLQALGNVRDGDIFIASLVACTEAVKEPDRTALDMIIENEEHARNIHRKRLKKLLQALNEKHCMKRFDAFVHASLKHTAKQKTAAPHEQSLYESARFIVPDLLGVFLSQGSDVLSHPRKKEKLHGMRIDGKRVRYGMEIFSEIFGGEYTRCLEEMKTLLDIMGSIHDCDVHIPKIIQQCEEIRSFNAHRSIRSERIRVQGLEGYLRGLRRRRTLLFKEMGEKLKRFDREKFTEIVIQSMIQ